MISRSIASISFTTTNDFDQNLSHLIELILQTPDNAIVVAPEVCLTGFAYDRFDEASKFSDSAIKKLFEILDDRVFIFTAISKKGSDFYNIAYALHKNSIVHAQPKVKLFTLGGEIEHFTRGNIDDITIIEIDGIKISMLICFELRFKELWQRLEGSDIIAIPSRWGRPRAAHFKTLTNALAVINQCYVIASDDSSEEFSAEAGIIDPFGVEVRNGEDEVLNMMFEAKQVKAMRRYLSVGI